MPGNPFKGAWSRLSLKKLNRVPTLCEDDIQTIQMCLDREVVDVHRLSNEDFLREWELSEVPKEVVDAAIDPHQLAVMAAHAWKVQAAKRATEKGKGSVGSSSGGIQ
ncbi:uncharacterized protein LOC122069593 isoform X2 [Macadamia integrifolia]|uniref:uncharacterized protein LOC122069593 isoform X2 n=1 Tax=Macadamia integrifolia TaxID=60698 RepID=UPI001C4ED272|nr:uncharacterized protein LOC122069593 isoform X2 [Macadamia integrifolia]